MNRLRALNALIRSDFMERSRRYSFLLTIVVMLFLGVNAVAPIESGMLTVNLAHVGGLRGIYNSAWIGGIVALISSMLLSLPGFYLVKNAIERDRATKVGAIIAATWFIGPLQNFPPPGFIGLGSAPDPGKMASCLAISLSLVAAGLAGRWRQSRS